jgi:uncharacterized protein YjbI with pentapeptide repeats
MADEEQVKRLLAGVEGWNEWRKENLEIEIDLSEADLSKYNFSNTDLSEANLRGANLIGVNLIGVRLDGANLIGARLDGADLRGTHLKGVFLRGAHLSAALFDGADLSGANLNGAGLSGAHLNLARLSEADLRDANLNGADLRGSILIGANLSRAELINADLKETRLGGTILGDIDLSETKGLAEVIHFSPSIIGTNTMQLSRGQISEKFLRGCGLSNWEIESAKLYRPGLSTQEVDNILYCVHDLRVGQALQFNPLFISYNHKDKSFVDEMERHLDNKGIRFWRDIHNATAGPLEKIVDRAMRLNPTVLLVLSENSVKSDWVEHEARQARELAKELGRDVLCPVALDETWKTCSWPARLREQIMEYNILDFSQWQDAAEFAAMFKKLIAGLDLFYKEPQ